MGMEAGQYVRGLYNLDGQLRRLEYLDARIFIPGLRLAVGFLNDIVFMNVIGLGSIYRVATIS